METKKKKIVVFTGAGVSAESGINTFRGITNGLWYDYNVEEVATPTGWKKDRAKVLEFHNMLRSKLPTVMPNAAHKAIATLEDKYDVTVITQNVDDLHERGGSTNILHLHGELTKARGVQFHHKDSELDVVYDIGYENINEGDVCKTHNTQIRPHIVWFEEMPHNVIEAYEALDEADILLVIGTSLQITYTIPMLASVKPECEVYYIDPNPVTALENMGVKVNYICEKASKGVTEMVNKLMTTEQDV
jgi:NAD-dependent deacetylase